MSVCPACGLDLPAQARFCARCGSRLPEPALQATPVWAIVVLALGAAIAALVAASYGLILAAPDLANSQGGAKLDTGQLRLSAGLLAAAGTTMFGLQLAALIGLARRRHWARVVGTLAAAGWALTCIGLPIAGLLLHLIWHVPATASPPRSPTGSTGG